MIDTLHVPGRCSNTTTTDNNNIVWSGIQNSTNTNTLLGSTPTKVPGNDGS